MTSEFRGWLTDTYSIWEPVMSHAGLQSGQTTAATGTRRAVFTANDVRALIARNLRSLVCPCPATQQPVDLQIYADYATLTRIVSNSVRFRVRTAARIIRPRWQRLAQRLFGSDLSKRTAQGTRRRTQRSWTMWRTLAVGLDLRPLTKRESVSACR